MKTLTTLFLTAVSSVMLAQIPNAGFEGGWTSNNPTATPIGWYDLNSIYSGSVQRSGNAHTGNFSAELDASSPVGGKYYGGFLETGTLGSPYFITGLGTSNPGALTGWYELNSVGGDQLEVSVITKSSSINGGGTKKISTSTPVGVWEQFNVCITVAGTADSASIILELINSSNGDTIHATSDTYIDDLAWGACTSGVEDINNNVTLEPSYPNPANNVCNIIFSIPGTSKVNADLYDINGRKMMNLMDNANLTSGRYKIPVDVSKFANGVYFYTITVDGVPYTQKLVVAK